MRKLALLLVILTVLNISAIAEGGARTEPLVISVSEKDFSTWEWRGDTENAKFRVLSSRAQANRFLRELPPLARDSIGEELAGVNFRRDAAIIAYLGATSGGHEVEIGQVNINAESLLVRVGMRSPGEDDMVTMILTHPWDMVTVPKKQMPAGDFQFIAFNQHGEVAADQWMNLRTPGKAISHRKVWYKISTVRTGDSLWAIAQENETTVEELMRLNGLTDSHLLIGQHLIIPSR
jgi:hypothetical protein